MLKVLRKNMKWILWALIGTFVLWGVGSGVMTKNKGSQYAGTVFGKNTTYAEFQRAWEGVKNEGILAYGEAFPLKARTMDLNGEIWRRIILLSDAKRKRISVSSKEVVTIIGQVPYFQVNGKFDTPTYKRVVQNYFKTTPQEFEDSIKDTLVIEKLQDSILKDVSVTPAEVKQEYERTYQKTTVSYIFVKTNEFVPEIQVSDEQIKDYYNKNLDFFKKQAQVNVQYIGPLDDKKAKDISDKLIDTPDLAAVAKETGVEAKETGFFQLEDEISDIGHSVEFAGVAFDLEQNKISQPFKLEKGYYIIKKLSSKEPYLPAFEDSKEKARQLLISELASKKAQAYAQNTLYKINDILKEPNATFEGAAAKTQASVVKTDPFTINEEIKGLGPARELADILFSLEAGQVSQVVPVAKGFCIIKIDQVQPVDEKKFKEEKEAFERALLQKKKIITYMTWFSSLIKQADVQSNIGSQQ